VQKLERREVARYHLERHQDPDSSICPHLTIRAYAYRAAMGPGAATGQDDTRGDVRIWPHQGTVVHQRPLNAVDGARTVSQELSEAPETGGARVWVAELSPNGALSPRGDGMVLVALVDRQAGTVRVRRDRTAEVLGEQENGPGEGSTVVIGYDRGEEPRELLGRVLRRHEMWFDVQPASLPRTEGGYPVKVADLGVGGIRLRGDDGLVRFLSARRHEDEVADPRELVGSTLVLSLYPRLVLMPTAEADIKPRVPGRLHLLGRVARAWRDEGEGSPVLLTVEFEYEAQRYDRTSSMPGSWRRLRQPFGSADLWELHRCLRWLEATRERSPVS
jgi:hypothetical protein